MLHLQEFCYGSSKKKGPSQENDGTKKRADIIKEKYKRSNVEERTQSNSTQAADTDILTAQKAKNKSAEYIGGLSGTGETNQDSNKGGKSRWDRK